MDLGLAGRVVVVTGGARGLGRAAVDSLVAEGARVVVSGRRPDTLEQVAATHGDVVTTVVADNAAADTPGRLLAAAHETWGRVDAALVSVGGPPRGSVAHTSDEQWRTSFESVFLGAVRLGRELAAALGEGGSLAFVLSSSVRVPLESMAISNGLRPGLGAVAKQLADEHGPRGVRVNGLLPGRVRTERLVELGIVDEEPAEIPLRRFGEPEEFGRVAAFLLSPAASFVSGAMVPVDGGMLRAL